jgi:type I restriction enzyme R subunit
MFNEANTVEDYLRHLLSGTAPTAPPGRARDVGGTYATVGRQRAGVGWHYLPATALPRQANDVFIETFVRDALIRLNPDIAATPDRAEEVLYKLRAIVLAVRSDGLISANEQFTEWLRGNKTMPFGENYAHVPIRLIDFDHLDNNQYIVTSQYTYRAGATEKRPDLVLLVNGFPLVIIEAKTPVRQAVSWIDGAIQIHDDYEKTIPELFACNVFSVASEGKELRYGSIRMPIELWGPWRRDDEAPTANLAALNQAISTLLQPATLLDILANYTLFATDKKKRRLKVVCRYQQYDAGNKILQRVIAGHPKKGLIWHFQGSGKSLLMVFTAQKLRMAPQLRNPTVLIVVDRIDLDAQISSTFHASDIPNLEKANTREELETLLRQDTRKIIITTIHKFAEADGELNPRDNIIVMVDEAHRTQEGDLGRKMRDALPNAFFFGLTGTPINKRDRNTFFAFGAEEDENGYMSRYDFRDSIRDGATLPIHFEARLVELHIDKEAIDAAYAELTGGLSDLDRDNLSKAAARTAVLVKVPDRIQRICGDIIGHYREKVEPNGFKARANAYSE